MQEISIRRSLLLAFTLLIGGTLVYAHANIENIHSENVLEDLVETGVDAVVAERFGLLTGAAKAADPTWGDQPRCALVSIPTAIQAESSPTGSIRGCSGHEHRIRGREGTCT